MRSRSASASAFHIVDRAVYLNDQSRLVAVEVRDQAVDDLLTAEVEAVQFVRAQMLPEGCLGGRHRLPELLRPLLLRRVMPAHHDPGFGGIHFA